MHEIKTTTNSLTRELSSMRKFMEEMHITANEKDAEIIKLKMHLGDEKTRHVRESQRTLIGRPRSNSR
jgi:hypothetical protein